VAFVFSFHHKHSFAVFKKRGKKPHSEAVKKGQKKYTYAKGVKRKGAKNTSGFATPNFIYSSHF